MGDQCEYFCRMLSGRLPCSGSYPSTSEYDTSCMWVGQLTYFISSARGSFDATYLYQYTFILLYNLVFTSLPVIVLGGTSCYSSRSSFNTHFSSIRPRHQCKGRVGIPTALYTWYSWSGIHANQILVIHGRWIISVCYRVFHSLLGLDCWVTELMEWKGN